MNVNDVHSLRSCSNVSFLAAQKKWTCWWRYVFWAKNTSCYSKLYRSSTTLATQFWGGDSPPVRERGRLGGGGTGGTFCDVRLAASSKFLEMDLCFFMFYLRGCSLNLSASPYNKELKMPKNDNALSFVVCLFAPSFIHSCIVSHAVTVALSFFRKVLPEPCSRIKTPNARKAAIPSIIELSRGQLLVILVCKFE